MTVHFEFYESPNPNGEKAEKRYHARPVSYKTVTTDKIVKDIHAKTTLTEADVRAALCGLKESMSYFLSEGQRVHLEGIGYFQITLCCSKEIDPTKTRAKSVWFKSVKFRADKALNGMLAGVMTMRSPLKRHSAELTETQIDKKLAKFFSEEKLLTRKKFEALCGFTRSTALRHIKRLLKEGKIENINTKWHPIYVEVVK